MPLPLLTDPVSYHVLYNLNHTLSSVLVTPDTTDKIMKMLDLRVASSDEVFNSKHMFGSVCHHGLIDTKKLTSRLSEEKNMHQLTYMNCEHLLVRVHFVTSHNSSRWPPTNYFTV
jgi:hypothetical protein